jgi:hypothetical protein
MESVLLGLAGPAAAGTAGSLLERTLHAAAEPFAAVLQAASSALKQEEGGGAGAVTLEGLHESLQTLRDDLAAKIEKALRNAGIDLAEPLALRISPTDGQIDVAGDHPQKALIEAALADSSGLVDSFNEVAALAQLLTTIAKPTDPETVSLGEVEQGGITALFTVDENGATLEFN